MKTTSFLIALTITIAIGACVESVPAPGGAPSTDNVYVTSFSLIDTTDGTIVSEYTPILDGTTINVDHPISIRAETTGGVASVEFYVDGSYERTENNAPYAIAGNSGTTYYAFDVIGTHTIEATPVASDGTLGTPKKIVVTIETNTTNDTTNGTTDNGTDTTTDNSTHDTTDDTGGSSDLMTFDTDVTLTVGPGEDHETIQAGLDAAENLRAQGSSVKVLVREGDYREFLRVGGSSGPLIALVGEGRVRVLGSERFSDWSCSGGACTRSWPYDWGVPDNPWSDRMDIGELARHREIVVGTENYEQVLSEADLHAGSFFVDNAADVLHVRLASGDAPEDLEIGVRQGTLEGDISNFAISNVEFSYAATEWRSHDPTSASVSLSGSDIVLDHARFTWNGEDGFRVSGSDLTIRDSLFDDNGIEGFTMYGVENVLIENSANSGNDWRGARGGYIDWAVGQKIFRARNVTFRNHEANDNYASGLWFDWDNLDVTVQNYTACNNKKSGLFLEAGQGPHVVHDITLCNNDFSGLHVNGIANLELSNARIFGNGDTNDHGQIRIVQTDRVVEGWPAKLENWDVSNLELDANDDSLLVYAWMWDGADRDLFASTSSWDGNTYQAARNDPFQWGGRSVRMTFDEWRTATGFDSSSTYE